MTPDPKATVIDGVPHYGFEAGVVYVPVPLVKGLSEASGYAEAQIRNFFREWIHGEFSDTVAGFAPGLSVEGLLPRFASWRKDANARLKARRDAALAESKRRLAEAEAKIAELQAQLRPASV